MPICSIQTSMCLVRFVICVMATAREHKETRAENGKGRKLGIVMPGRADIAHKVGCDLHIRGDNANANTCTPDRSLC